MFLNMNFIDFIFINIYLSPNVHVYVNLWIKSFFYFLFLGPLISVESGLNGSFISNADHKLSNLKDRQYAEKDDTI